MITTTSPFNFDKSTNKGLTWTTVSNLTQAQRGITVSGLNTFYTSGNGGVFRSLNNGQSFENFNFTNSATPILSFQYFAVLYIAVGTSGSASGGVWIYPEAAIQSTNGENENAVRFNLFQNYPNPFNPNTVIQYSVIENLFVTLKVYDILGNEILTLVNEKRPAGNHSVEWDASGYPSGVYYYKIQSGNFISTRKMLLVK
ncbi:MAG: T9SS type A sorting domain-containing protein [Ignavibacteria bacterium]|nr:T9SS type A sorting domain-containing protein [Ignavibacteria bacterium]